MKNVLFGLAIVFALQITANAQLVRLKLSRQVNVPDFNHFAPSLTADGQTILFASDYYLSNGNKSELKLCKSKGLDNWGSIEEVTIINKSGNLNQHGGHCISSDGNTIYFSSRKTGGVAGYDIWVSEKVNGNWYNPYNLGKPVNSAGMEGFPSLSPDGKSLYFVRCETMDNKNCENCKVFVAEAKGKGLWNEPKALPASINTGNTMFPRILKDGNTLIFSSNKPGGKGGYDLYIAKKEGNGWSKPQNLVDINTSEDEIFADMSVHTDALTYASFQDQYWTLFKAKLSETTQPEAVFLFEGELKGVGKNLIKAFVQVSDNSTSSPISMNPISKEGNFSVVLPKGSVYDVAITLGNDNFYWSSTIDAKQLVRSGIKLVDVPIVALKQGKFIQGNKALFDSTNYRLLTGANLECKRIAKLMQSHPNWMMELVLFPNGIANNEPEDPNAVFEAMKTSMETALTQIGLASDKLVFTNGFGTPEEEDNYSGWGIKIQ